MKSKNGSASFVTQKRVVHSVNRQREIKTELSKIMSNYIHYLQIVIIKNIMYSSRVVLRIYDPPR